MMQNILEWINSDGRYDTAFWGKDRWEMRDVEHTLCEFDKYRRVATGLGKPRSLFKPSR